MSEEEEAEQAQAEEENATLEDQVVQSEDSGSEEENDASTEAEGTQADSADELKKQIEALEKERDDYKDKWMRSVADFQNLRKRSIQEKQEAFDYGNASLLKDLLESLDNFDRTVEAAATATDAKSIADGVTMINKSLVSMLENKYNLVAYGAVGDAFDPDIHEAIGRSEEQVEEPTVKAVYLKGYKLKDRVIRHAKVMVALPPESGN